MANITSFIIANAGISVILKNAAALASIVGVTPPSVWMNISQNIVVLKDNNSGVTLEYDGFNGSTAVKQADVVVCTISFNLSCLHQ
jgi:hypothetical protein